jgi:hypothetical protein
MIPVPADFTDAEAKCARFIIGVINDLPPVERLRAIAAMKAMVGLDAKPASRRRKPSIATMIKRAEKSGKEVTSIVTPDGTTLNFGEAEPSEADINELDKWLRGKNARQA